MAFKPNVRAPKIHPERVFLLDGDILTYDCAYGVEDDQVENMRLVMDMKIKGLLEMTGCKDTECFLTGGTNFRDAVAVTKQYKGNRYHPDGSRKAPQPAHLVTARAHLISKWGATVSTVDEADDQISIRNWEIITGCDPKYDLAIIGTTDKDIGINPGYYMRISDDDIQQHCGFGELYLNKSGKCKGWGLKFFLAQLLMGDSTDYIPGLPKVPMEGKLKYGLRRGGFGDKGAYTVLNDVADYPTGLAMVFQLYQWYCDEFHPMRYAKSWRGEKIRTEAHTLITEQGRLLWMRRKQGEMWNVGLDYSRLEDELWVSYELPMI